MLFLTLIRVSPALLDNAVSPVERVLVQNFSFPLIYLSSFKTKSYFRERKLGEVKYKNYK